MKTKWIYLVGMALIFGATSCKKEGCVDPNATNYDQEAKKDDGTCIYDDNKSNTTTQAQEKSILTLHFHPMVGTESFYYDHTYTLPSGRKFQFTRAQFYVSGIDLKGSGADDFSDNYILVDAGQMLYEVAEFNAGNFTGLSFNVGVDSATNHTDPATYASGHALAPKNPSMHWGWNPGYLFIAVEGIVDTTSSMTGNMDGRFEWHVGLDKALRNVDLSKSYSVDQGSDLELMVHVNYAKLFDGLDMTADTVTHSMGAEYALAEKIANNLQSAFMMQ